MNNNQMTPQSPPQKDKNKSGIRIAWVLGAVVILGLTAYILYSAFWTRLTPRFPETRSCETFNDCSYYCEISQEKQDEIYKKAGCTELEGIDAGMCRWNAFPGGGTLCNDKDQCICGVFSEQPL